MTRAPSNNALMGYVRQFASGAKWSCISSDPPWGLTQEQAQEARAGGKVSLEDGSVVTFVE